MPNTVDTYGIVQKKEDVSNIISMISPTDAPFTTLTGKDTVKNWDFNWMEDVLRSSAANAQLEGFTASPTSRTQPTLKENVTQIFQDTYEVTGTTDAISIYGRAKESARLAANAAKALKLDYERACVGSAQTMVKPTDNSSARVFAGVQAMINTANRLPTGGTTTAPTEANYLSVLGTVYKAGGKPSVTMVTPDDALIIADFAKASGRARQLPNSGAGSKQVVNVVELYVSPYGEQKIVLNRELKSTDMLILDPEMWVKITLQGRDWFREQLAKVGDKQGYMIVGEFSLKNKNSKGSGFITRAVS